VLRKAKVLANAGWTARAVRLKDGLVSIPHHMNMCRPMVVRINEDSETGQP
jgi:hypothetical protein